LQGILHDTESKIEEFKDQLPAEDAAKMKEKCADVRLKLQVSSRYSSTGTSWQEMDLSSRLIA
jgi:hypothetical protein